MSWIRSENERWAMDEKTVGMEIKNGQAKTSTQWTDDLIKIATNLIGTVQEKMTNIRGGLCAVVDETKD